MNLLLLTPQLPWPAFQGTTLRNFHIIEELAKRHRITLLSFVEDDEEFGPLAELCHEIVTIPVPQRSTSLRLLQLLTTRKSDMEHRLASIAFDISLYTLLEEDDFDVVQIEGIELARCIQIVREVSPASRIVFDNHNAETELQRRAMETDLRSPKRWVAAAYSWVQVQRLARFERWACETADAVTTVSELDRAALPETTTPKYVIPNCIDVGSYQSYQGAVEPFEVVFTGKMDYRPNIDAVLWFVDEIWPSVRSAHPNARFAIVGQKPHARLERLRTVPGVTITGRVPSVLPYLYGASIFVMPLRMGSGTRLKLIEAFAAGKTVVSTTIGAAGYDVVNGEQLHLADDSAEFANAINDYLTHPEKASKLASAGTQFAQNYDRTVIVPAFEDVYSL